MKKRILITLALSALFGCHHPEPVIEQKVMARPQAEQQAAQPVKVAIPRFKVSFPGDLGTVIDAYENKRYNLELLGHYVSFKAEKRCNGFYYCFEREDGLTHEGFINNEKFSELYLTIEKKVKESGYKPTIETFL